MKWLSFKGVKSLAFGMIIEKMPPLPVPVRNYTSVDIPGRSGALMLDGGNYNDVELAVTLNYHGGDAQVSDINEWLSGRGELIFSEAADYKYIATLVKSPAVTRRRLADGQNHDSLEVKFLCEPFRYEAEPSVITLSEGAFVPGEGTVDAEPVIVVNGTGDVTLTVGETTLTLTGLTAGITIDCARRLAYSGTTSLSHLVSGEWPKLSTESTAISWTGNVTGVTVTPNWRWL